MIVIIVFIIVLGIIAVHFGFQSKKEQRKNKSIACIYVGDKKSVWILGNTSFWGGTLEGILLLFSYNTDYLCIFLFMFLMAQWGAALFLWHHFCYSAVFLHDGKICYYYKMKKKKIGIDNIADFKVALGNVAYAFFDENDNMLFQIQMKKENAVEFMKYITEKMLLSSFIEKIPVK